ncbi:hypothetical protein E1267_03955 [Nonomuraea longispora]|uniref:Bacterial transcriptional activator domain-containing protein n=1 Tax=Nonomuraea longispora TaxID=1848320 RepID=A0A4R4NTD8_9ACTN|nr:hypothetical protein E1267_03955 [Nonomuraea longispora]
MPAARRGVGPAGGAAAGGRLAADLSLGRNADVIPELHALIADHPTRERFTAQLMIALYRAGRQAEALRAYQRTRQALVDGLGLEPRPELRELHQAVLRGDPVAERKEPETSADKAGVPVATPLYLRGRWREQIAIGRLAVEAAARADDLRCQAVAHSDLGGAMTRFGDPAEGVTHLRAVHSLVPPGP